MTTEQSAATQISELLAGIGASDIENDLIRRQDLGRQLNFSDSRELFEDLLQFTSQLSALTWQKLPRQPQNDILSHLQQVDNAVQQIKDFSSATQGEGDRDSYVTQLRNQLDAFKQVVVPFVGYLSWDSIDLDEYQRSLDRNIEEGRETLQRATEEVESAKVSAEEALSAIRAAAAEAGVSQEAQTFHEAANRYESSAKKWLIWSICSALVTIGVGITIVFIWNSIGSNDTASDNGPSTAVVVQAILGRAAVLAVLTYATVTAVRVYRSSAHLAVVNRHREDALKSFNAFMEGTDADETKNQILLAAAHAAFGQTATGLISEKADGGNTLEVFEGLFGRSVRGS